MPSHNPPVGSGYPNPEPTNKGLSVFQPSPTEHYQHWSSSRWNPNGKPSSSRTVTDSDRDAPVTMRWKGSSRASNNVRSTFWTRILRNASTVSTIKPSSTRSTPSRSYAGSSRRGWKQACWTAKPCSPPSTVPRKAKSSRPCWPISPCTAWRRLTVSESTFSLAFGPPLWVLVSNVVQSTGCFHDCIRHAVPGIAQHILDDATAFHSCEIMFHLDPNLCQLPVGSFLSLREVSSGWLFFSPGRFSSLLAHNPGIRYPCTRWPPAGRRSLPHRLSFCRASCRGTFGRGSQSVCPGC